MKRFLVVYGICCLGLLGCGQSGTVSASAASTPSPKQPVTTGDAATPTPTPVSDREVVIPAGTALLVTLETSVGSDISAVEQPVRAQLRRSVVVGDDRVLPAGTLLLGNVTAADRPGRVKGRGYVAMRFTEIETPVGREHITTRTVGARAPATKERDAIDILAPATGAAIVGRLVGGKKGAGEGAVIGGAAGTGYVLSTRGKDVRLGKGAPLTVRLSAPVSVNVPQR